MPIHCPIFNEWNNRIYSEFLCKERLYSSGNEQGCKNQSNIPPKENLIRQTRIPCSDLDERKKSLKYELPRVSEKTIHQCNHGAHSVYKDQPKPLVNSGNEKENNWLTPQVLLSFALDNNVKKKKKNLRSSSQTPRIRKVTNGNQEKWSSIGNESKINLGLKNRGNFSIKKDQTKDSLRNIWRPVIGKRKSREMIYNWRLMQNELNFEQIQLKFCFQAHSWLWANPVFMLCKI